jgi:general secretion pathway protein C
MASTTISSIRVKPRWRLVFGVCIADISKVLSSMMNHNPLMLSQRPSFATAISASSRLVLPVATLVVWGAVAFSAVTWGLRWSATGAAPSNATTAAQALPELDVSAAARSLGAAPVQAAAAPTLASRFQLQGVMAGGPNAGAALIVVDGKAAKPYRVGAVVADGLVLQSAQGRRVTLGAAMDGPQTLVLELPAKK